MVNLIYVVEGKRIMFDRIQFGARLLSLREKNGLSQQTVAAILGVTRTQISDMENGKSGTNLDRLYQLCYYYKVSADYLLGITDDPTWRGE